MNRKVCVIGLSLIAILAGCGDEKLTAARGKVDAERSTVEVDRAVGVVADGTDAVRVTVTARDEDGNALEGRSVVLDVDGDAVTLSEAPRTNEAGVSQAWLTSTRAQTVTLIATVEGVELANKPTVEFIAGEAAKLAFVAQPVDGVAGAVLSSVLVELLDAQGNRVRDANTSMTIALNKEATLGGTLMATVPEGVAAFSDLSIQKAAVGYTLVASVQGLADAESDPFDISPAALDTSRSSLSANPQSAVADGVEVIVLSVEGRDAFGNAIPALPVSLGSSTASDSLGEVSGETDDSGNFTTTLTATKSGERTLTADVGGNTLTTQATFTAGPPSSVYTTLTASDGPHIADDVDEATLTIVVADANENPISGAEIRLGSNGTNDRFSPVTESPARPGSYTATMASRKAETKTVSASVGDVTVTDDVTFVAGAPVAAQSSVLATPSSVYADGTSEILVEAIVRDFFRNPVPNAQVSLEMDDEGNNIASPENTDAAGATSGTVSSAVPGVKTIRVFADGTLIGELEVTFIAVFSVGGVVTGLSGKGLVIVNSDGGESLGIGANGAFTFTTLVPSGSGYDIRITHQPTGQACAVIKGSGSTLAHDVTNIDVKCGSIWEKVASSPNASFTLGIKKDGTLWSWGHNDSGQLGDGSKDDRNAPVQVDTDAHFRSVAAGGTHSVAVKSDGTLWTWGYGWLGEGPSAQRSSPQQVGTDSDYASVAAGAFHTVAVKTDGTLWAWGYNYYGQLGNNSTTNEAAPVRIGEDDDFVSVAAGPSHTLALRKDGTLWAWGANLNGELGVGSTTTQLSPARVGSAMGFGSVDSVAAGYAHTLAIKTDGTLWAWGNNSFGQFGNGSTTNRTVPTRVGTASDFRVKTAETPDLVSIAAGITHTLVVKADGTLWGLDLDEDDLSGDGFVPGPRSLVQLGTHFASITAGLYHSAGVKSDGTLWAWGNNEHGRLGGGSRHTPVRVGTDRDVDTGFVLVAAGNNHTLAVKADGTLWAWGDNDDGQLGDGSTTPRNAPVLIGTGFATDATVASISAGEKHSVAVKADGTLWTWGENYSGQLGLGSTARRTLPTRVGTDADFVSVSAGQSYTLAVKTNGAVWGWGANYSGQLGIGTTSAQTTPALVGWDMGFDAIAAGGYHTAALKTDGTLWTWGSNGFGQLGDGSGSGRSWPAPSGDNTNFAFVCSGQNHTAGIKTDGTLWTWGANYSGQLGVDSTPQQDTPVQIGQDTDFALVAAGPDHTVAVKQDGTLRAWGANYAGQLGDGSTEERTTPVPVGTDSGFVAVAAGESHTVGLKSDGTLWAWGRSDEGQIGDGGGAVRVFPGFIY